MQLIKKSIVKLSYSWTILIMRFIHKSHTNPHTMKHKATACVCKHFLPALLSRKQSSVEKTEKVLGGGMGRGGGWCPWKGPDKEKVFG